MTALSLLDLNEQTRALLGKSLRCHEHLITPLFTSRGRIK